MKSKLTYYLNKEASLLTDILMQSEEIKKSIESDDLEAINRLFDGRGKNIIEANRFQNAMADMLNRSEEDLLSPGSAAGDLRARNRATLCAIIELDKEISVLLSEGYADSKKEYKRAKELKLVQKGYGLGKPPSRHFDKKT